VNISGQKKTGQTAPGLFLVLLINGLLIGTDDTILYTKEKNWN